MHTPGGIRSTYVADPFHYSFEEMSMAAKFADLAIERIGDWAHPRASKNAVLQAKVMMNSHR